MQYNVLIGGAAGQGIDTVAAIFEAILKKNSFEIFTIRDYMSRIRGGHNFIQIRFGNETILSHSNYFDVILALNEETINIHNSRLKKNGIILCDEEIKITTSHVIKLPFKQIAKDLGNIKSINTVMLGCVLKLFGIELSHLEDAIKESFKDEKILEINYQAGKKGYSLVDLKYQLEKAKTETKMLISGNEAIALGAMAANCKFYTGYPMTPSTSILEYLAARSAAAKIVVEQAEDEIAAINMAIGASYAGVRSMVGTSGGGFSLMVEGLGFASIAEIPIVIIEAQRPGPATGFPTRTEQSDLKFVISASQGEGPRMVIAVRNPEDAFQQTIRAFNLADKYQIPVIILTDQYMADTTTTVKVFDTDNIKREQYITYDVKDEDYLRYKLTDTGISDRILPGKAKDKTLIVDSDEHDEKGLITESANMRIEMVNKRLKKFELLKKELIEPEVIGTGIEMVLVGWGSTYYPLKEAINMLEKANINCSAIVFGDIFPLPTNEIARLRQKAKILINVEQNATGQLAGLIRENTGIKCDTSILKYDGRPLSADEIYEKAKNIYLKISHKN